MGLFRVLYVFGQLDSSRSAPNKTGGCCFATTNGVVITRWGWGTKSHARSLKTKWGDIMASITKICDVHNVVVALDESGPTNEDIFIKVSEIYKHEIDKPLCRGIARVCSNPIHILP